MWEAKMQKHRIAIIVIDSNSNEISSFLLCKVKGWTK